MSDTEQKDRELPAAAIAALKKGRKIEAVKLLRSEWNVDLKEAKNYVDQYLSSVNSSQGARKAPTVDAGIGRLLPVIIVVIVVVIFLFLVESGK